jgi:conjugative transfer region protein TrbK
VDDGAVGHLRAAAIIVLIVAILGAFRVTGQRIARPPAADFRTPSFVDDLSPELRRCSALGPQDAEDPRCVAVWEENRRRFFGGPARPLAPAAAPANASAASSRAELEAHDDQCRRHRYFHQHVHDYIDSGFGLIKGDVAYLSSTLIVIDITLAGIFWAWALTRTLCSAW